MGTYATILHDAFYFFKKPWLKDWIVKLANSWIYDVPCACSHYCGNEGYLKAFIEYA